MNDTHLLNTVKLILDKIWEVNKLGWREKLTAMELAMFWDYMISTEEAAEQIVKYTNKILPYIFECSIRWINVTEILQETYWRKWNNILEES